MSKVQRVRHVIAQGLLREHLTGAGLALGVILAGAAVAMSCASPDRATPTPEPDAFVRVSSTYDWTVALAVYRHTKTGHCFVVVSSGSGASSVIEVDKAVCE